MATARAEKLAAQKMNVFRDAAGQPTTDADTIIAIAKKLLGADYPKVDDVQALAILNSVPGDDKDETVAAAREAKLKAARPVTKQQALADTTLPNMAPKGLTPQSAVPSWRAMAVRIGSELDGTDFDSLVQVAADAKEDYEGAALLIVNTLEKRFGEIRNAKGEITRPNQMVDWPIPGSGTKKWKEKNPGANGPFDHYEFDGADGGKHSGSVYGDILDTTKGGQIVVANIAALKAMKANNCAALPTTPKQFRDLEKGGEPAVLGMLNRWLARRRNPLGRLEKAVRFLQSKAKLSEFPKIALDFIEKDMAQAAKMPSPFKLLSRVTKDDGAVELVSHGVLSLGSFISLKFDELAKLPPDEQTAPKLIALSRRKKETPPAAGAKAEGLTIDVHNVRQCEAAMSALINYIDNEDAIKSMYSILNRDGDDKDRILDNIDSLYSSLSMLHKKYKVQIEARQQELKTAADAEAKAKLAKAA